MNLANASVQRPVFTTMLMLMIIVLGSMALSRLQINLLPSIELPNLTVRTEYQGADPIVMERLVTQILEEIIATVPGVMEMRSSSYEGKSNIKVTFDWDTDINSTAVDVLSTIEDEISELPDDIVRPRINKFDIDSFPVVLLGISSKLDPVELTQLIEEQIRYRFGRIPGVAQVDPWGSFDREVRIELDPTKINAFNLSVEDILTAIRNANLDLPAGKLQQGRYQITLRTPAEFNDLAQIRNLVITRHEGMLVTLKQIAIVKDTYTKLTRIVRVNGGRGIRIAIRKQPNANTVEVSKQILAEVQALNQTFPQLKIVPVINQGNFIERSIANVAQSILYGGSLAILILLFFLRDWRSTLVISTAIPISVFATFALLYFNGFSLNLMTLGGLALGIGMMVDSSVVVLENIFRRHQELGESATIAAINGTNEVTTAVIAGTITTLVIFLPLIFITGVSGILFQELAYVIMFSLFCALLVSLSLVPMLASKLIKTTTDNNHLYSMEQSYCKLLRLALDERWFIILLSVLVFTASLFLIPKIGTEFIPPSDEGEIRINGDMGPGIHLDIVDKQTKLLESLVYPLVPEAISSVTTVMAAGTRGSSKAWGGIRMSLLPAAERQRSNIKIAQDLRKKLEGKVPGMKIRVRAPQGQFLLERILKNVEGITVEVRGFDLDILTNLAKQVQTVIADIPGITDVEISRKTGIPQQKININRAKIADLGLTVRDITETIRTAVAGSKVGEYRVDGNSYRIFVQLADAEQRSIEEILDLTLRLPSGEQVALRNCVTVETSYGPVKIERKNQQRLVKVNINVSGRDLGSIATEIQERLTQIPLPSGYDLLIAGQFEKQQQAFQELMISLALALLLVYMVLASQYESLRSPLIVMLSVPLAAIGVLLTLFLTETTLNLQSAIGCIMLGGIVVNNAILLVDQASNLCQTGMQTDLAIIEAGRRRLRPILMTTLTTILALLPLALGIGEGADAQAPLARAVVGGLIGSTLITLVLIPVVYSLFYYPNQLTKSLENFALH